MSFAGRFIYPSPSRDIGGLRCVGIDVCCLGEGVHWPYGGFYIVVFVDDDHDFDRRIIYYK
jgi:hypothetical protein